MSLECHFGCPGEVAVKPVGRETCTCTSSGDLTTYFRASQTALDPSALSPESSIGCFQLPCVSMKMFPKVDVTS